MANGCIKGHLLARLAAMLLLRHGYWEGVSLESSISSPPLLPLTPFSFTTSPFDGWERRKRLYIHAYIYIYIYVYIRPPPFPTRIVGIVTDPPPPPELWDENELLTYGLPLRSVLGYPVKAGNSVSNAIPI